MFPTKFDTSYIGIKNYAAAFLIFITSLLQSFVLDSNLVLQNNLKIISIHGLRTLHKVFFHWNSKFSGLDRQIGQINVGAFGLFLVDLSTHILALWVQCPRFPLINHYFYKKLSHFIQILNIYLGLGFEFGPWRIRVLAIVCP